MYYPFQENFNVRKAYNIKLKQDGYGQMLTNESPSLVCIYKISLVDT